MDATGRKCDAEPAEAPEPLGNDAAREARWAKWRADNAGAIAAYNTWFESEGHRYLRDPMF